MADFDAFVERFGGVYEHSPWVAEQTFDAAENVAMDARAQIFERCVESADYDTKMRLIRAHPDLAGKAQLAGELTADSTTEQTSAGLDQCTPEEYEQFQALNGRYKEKFGFPFVMAVRNSSRREILNAFERRLQSDYDDEFEATLIEIHKIARLRLEALGL